MSVFDLLIDFQSTMLRFSLALLCLVALAVAEDEKPPASIALDDKTFKEKVLAFQIEPFKMVKFIQFI